MEVASAEGTSGSVAPGAKAERGYLWTASSQRGSAALLTSSEALMESRFYGIDQGEGIHGCLDSQRQAKLPGHPTWSKGHARRLKSSLRRKGRLLPRGVLPDGRHAYVLPNKAYSDPDRLPACDPHRLAHLGWDTEAAARKLAQPHEPVAPAFLVDGFPVSRNIRTSHPEKRIRAAVAEIRRSYPDLSKIKSRDRLLWFMCRVLEDQERRQKKGAPPEQAFVAAVKAQRDTKADTKFSDDVLAGLRELLPTFGAGAKGSPVSSAPAPQAHRPEPPTPVSGNPPISGQPAPAAPRTPAASSATAAVFHTVRDALRYCAQHGWGGLVDKTRARYLQQAGILERYLGDLPLSELRRSHLHDYQAARQAEGIKPQTIKKEFIVLRQALAEAIGNRACSADVLSAFPKIRVKPPRKERVLTFEEYLKLRAELPPIRQDYLDLAVYTGARHSELERLERKHFDLAKGTLRIEGTKTDGAYRINPLPEPLRPMVKRCMGGRLLVPWTNVRRDLADACTRAGIEHATSNDLRRTFATWLAEGGVSELEIKRLLGHGRTSPMVARVYAQLGNEALARAVSVLPKAHAPP